MRSILAPAILAGRREKKAMRLILRLLIGGMVMASVCQAAGAYPLAVPLMLYVSPRASDTAKDFVRFLGTGAGAPVLRRHGFMPHSQPPR